MGIDQSQMEFFNIWTLVQSRKMLSTSLVATLGLSFFGAISGEAGEPNPKDIYAESCAVCHGMAGEGTMPGVPDLTVANGNFAKPEKELIGVIVNGIDRPGLETPMPPSGLDEITAKTVLDYLRALASEARQ